MAMAVACLTASPPSVVCLSKEAYRLSSSSYGASALPSLASPFLRPLRAGPKLHANIAKNRVTMSAGSSKEKDLAGPMALALIAAAVIPEIAEAASPGITPSLKNLLLSVVSGGVVLVAIGGAVAAVSLFDPVQRN